MDLGRALGFIAGGAATGYGQGIVEQAKMAWEEMLKHGDEDRADQREARRQTFEAGQNTQKQQFESGEDQKKIDADLAKSKAEIASRDREIKARIAEAHVQHEDTEAFRKAQLDEQRRYRQDQYNLRLRELGDKEAQLTNGDMKSIEDAEKSLFGQFPDPDQVEKGDPRIVDALRAAKNSRAADYYAKLHGFEASASQPSSPAPNGAAPGFGGQTRTDPVGTLDEGVDQTGGGPVGRDKPANAPPDAKQAPDGNWYSPDPARPGKYLKW